jgi:lambda family phage minor tail protein L
MVFQNIVNQYGDLIGCEVSRVRTFQQFLDGQLEADPTAYFGPDTFKVERKTDENPVYIEWELSASIDQQGVKLPRRQVLRDTCSLMYRVWNASTNSFDYTHATCPYTGSAYFDVHDNATTAAQDTCSLRLSSCKLRFQPAPLPYGGFPGVARVQQ